MDNQASPQPKSLVSAESLESLLRSAAEQDGPSGINPHFVDHMVESAGLHEMRASEDIVAGNGVMLLAKGARIDAGMRERLLQHKLVRPLEQCVSMADGVGAERLLELADGLLERHPLLQALIPPSLRSELRLQLGQLRLSPALQSLLTMLADLPGERLAHAVGVALIAQALAQHVQPGKPGLRRQLAVAGLMHDVGELYLDPRLLQRDTVLQPAQWRQIASHPVSGYRVLATMDGAGALVADVVLAHHERLDGFGYPRGLAELQFVLPAQLLAAAEWLMGLIESGVGPLMRASVASRLIPGEFSPAVLEPIYAAMRGNSEMAQWLAAQPVQPEALVQRIEALVQLLQRFRAMSGWLESRMAESGLQLRLVLARAQLRLGRLQTSFSSTGLDALDRAQLLADLRSQAEARTCQELSALLDEFAWRLRELARDGLLRASLLGEADQALMQALLDRLHGLEQAPLEGRTALV